MILCCKDRAKNIICKFLDVKKHFLSIKRQNTAHNRYLGRIKFICGGYGAGCFASVLGLRPAVLLFAEDGGPLLFANAHTAVPAGCCPKAEDVLPSVPRAVRRTAFLRIAVVEPRDSEEPQKNAFGCPLPEIVKNFIGRRSVCGRSVLRHDFFNIFAAEKNLQYIKLT